MGFKIPPRYVKSGSATEEKKKVIGILRHLGVPSRLNVLCLTLHLVTIHKNASTGVEYRPPVTDEHTQVLTYRVRVFKMIVFILLIPSCISNLFMLPENSGFCQSSS